MSLFETLPPGCFHLKDFLDRGEQGSLVQECKYLCATHPLMQPKTKTGWDLALRVSSWGRVGWFGANGNYTYLTRHENGQAFPGIPGVIFQTMMSAAHKAGYEPFRLDTVLMNYYPPKTGKLGKHQDITEEERESPIVTISLGDSCVFNIGSPDYNDKGMEIELKSGDVFVMGGASRLAYHSVVKLLPGTSDLLKQGGRISLTGRRVFKA